MEDLQVIEQQKQAITSIEAKVSQIVVDTPDDYRNAVDFCKEIKLRQNVITEYWKPLKEKAYGAWKDICAKEKQLSEPFTKAESCIKAKLSEYQRKKLEEERILKEEQERFRKEEEARLLKVAMEAEAEGKIEQAEYAMDQAEKAKNIQFAPIDPVRARDSSSSVTWKARIINESIVPVSIMGTVIRPVDVSALNKLAQISKGKVTIPGVEFYEDIKIAIKARYV